MNQSLVSNANCAGIINGLHEVRRLFLVCRKYKQHSSTKASSAHRHHAEASNPRSANGTHEDASRVTVEECDAD